MKPAEYARQIARSPEPALARLKELCLDREHPAARRDLRLLPRRGRRQHAHHLRGRSPHAAADVRLPAAGLRRYLCLSDYVEPAADGKRGRLRRVHGRDRRATKSRSRTQAALRREQVPGLPLPARPRRRVGGGAGGVLPPADCAPSGASAATTRRRSASSSRGTIAAAATPSATRPARTSKIRRGLFALIDPTAVGITLTEQFQLEPEQSTTAIVFHHPKAKYFNVKRGGEVEFE